ncbi:MAG: aldose 1-epimerase family protein [Eubacteriales bacterium]|jgi:hypothetical protein|nr:aldose 1-epimerase family protein [Eubacteriales bacterium]MDD4138600.1 aldose 1-epimerase family protein [Eubacteriales bacterium]MDD4745036.1 aldose 1-epimerase family protein [Eubacteriales bacterium]
MGRPVQPLSYRDQKRYTGSTDQLYSVRRLQLSEGGGDQMRLIDVKTAGGLQALFLESRALDLYELRYKGVNIGFASKNGLLSGRVMPGCDAFASSWPGGMLATCGLRNTGPACEHDGEVHPVHGQIGAMPAEQVGIQLDPEAGTLTLTGQMRESALFGHNLVLKRKLTLPLFGASIHWEDTVQNEAAEPEPLFLLYHFNFGHPFLGPELQMQFAPGEVIPRTEAAAGGLAEHDLISEPVDGCPEQVFFHLPLPGSKPEENVRLVRPDLRMAASLTWQRSELPWLVQWKSMKTGDYALGIEPSTSRIRGREQELLAGYDQIIKPYDTWQFHLRLEMESLD